MFDNVFASFKKSVRNHFDKKKLEREEMDKMQREVDFQERQAFRTEFRKNALQIAIGRAKKDAAKASGMQKLRAQNRLRNLKKSDASNPGNFLSNFQNYTQKNLAKREENMKQTEIMREEGRKIRENRLNKTTQNPGTRKPFEPSGFRR